MAKSKLLLPSKDWPEADKELWHAATGDDDPFADAAGARLAKSTLHVYWKAWRRFLGFLTISEGAALEIAPPQRLTAERVRRYVEHLQQTNTPRSVAIQIEMLYGVARAMIPDLDLHWLRVMRARLRSAAPRGRAAKPVITSVQLLELGLQLMEESNLSANAHSTMADGSAIEMAS